MLNSDNNYEFKVKVKNNFLNEYNHNGDTFIEGRKGSEYELYFKNNSYKRVMVIFSVDGLSVLDGKTASEKSEGYIVNGYGTLSIPGWRINSSKVAKFQFQPQNDKANTTYVELLVEEGFNVDPSNQGVLGCMVFEEKYVAPVVQNFYHHFPYYPNGMRGVSQPNWNNYDSSIIYGNLSSSGSLAGSVPASRSVALNCMNGMNDSYTDKGLGTAFGKDKIFETVNVEFEQQSAPAWVAAIHYDTIQGLKRRGIVIDSKPNPFPAYQGSGCYVPKRR